MKKKQPSFIMARAKDGTPYQHPKNRPARRMFAKLNTSRFQRKRLGVKAYMPFASTQPHVGKWL